MRSLLHRFLMDFQKQKEWNKGNPESVLLSNWRIVKEKFFQGLSIIIVFFIVSGCSHIQNETGILEGNVSIGPLSPVSQAGVVEPTPAPEVYSARQIVIYSKNGKNELAKVPIQSDGSYRIELKTGEYLVDINHIGMDFSKDLPVLIEIKADQSVHLEIDIDTGIR